MARLVVESGPAATHIIRGCSRSALIAITLLCVLCVLVEQRAEAQDKSLRIATLNTFMKPTYAVA